MWPDAQLCKITNAFNKKYATKSQSERALNLHEFVDRNTCDALEIAQEIRAHADRPPLQAGSSEPHGC